MKTEKEAAECWCPMVRQPQRVSNAMGNADGSPAACNTDHQGIRLRDGNNCMGSRCMLWRWAESPGSRDGNQEMLLDRARGYCGIAGKPEFAA